MILIVKLVFVEMPFFEKIRSDYLTDESYLAFQNEILKNPEAGDVIQGTSGLRKIRFRDESRGKGKRGGVRIIYYYWIKGKQIWLFTIYNKDEISDLTKRERQLLADMLASEIKARESHEKKTIR